MDHDLEAKSMPHRHSSYQNVTPIYFPYYWPDHLCQDMDHDLETKSMSHRHSSLLSVTPDEILLLAKPSLPAKVPCPCVRWTTTPLGAEPLGVTGFAGTILKAPSGTASATGTCTKRLQEHFLTPPPHAQQHNAPALMKQNQRTAPKTIHPNQSHSTNRAVHTAKDSSPARLAWKPHASGPLGKLECT